MEQADRDALLVRLDERTERMETAFTGHLAQDREDFKEVHSRINRIAAKQNWLMGVSASAGASLGLVLAILKDKIFS